MKRVVDVGWNGGNMEKCSWCEGTGKFKQPKDVKQYEEIFDKYDAPGTLTMGECREKALDEVGYYLVECPKCKGTGERKPSLDKKISQAKKLIKKAPKAHKKSDDDGGPTVDLGYPKSKEDGRQH